MEPDVCYARNGDVAIAYREFYERLSRSQPAGESTARGRKTASRC